MAEDKTLQHALSKHSIKDLKTLKKQFNGEPINPKANKPELIKTLVPNIPERYYDRIIDKAFSPKIRYTAHIAKYESELPTQERLKVLSQEYNQQNDYKDDEVYLGPREKRAFSIEHYYNNEKIVVLTFENNRKALEFDPESRKSYPAITPRMVRIVINDQEKIITIYTGDKDLFDVILLGLYSIIGKSIRPVSLNLSNVLDTSFSFHTVKVLDYLYHGLTKVGKLGIIKAIELDSPSKSKKPQVVKVKGEDLLVDESICKYLFIHGRDLVGLKLDLIFQDEDSSYSTAVELGFKQNKIKMSIKKEHHPIERIDRFLNVLEKNLKDNLESIGLINEKGTQQILQKIRDIAVK